MVARRQESRVCLPAGPGHERLDAGHRHSITRDRDGARAVAEAVLRRQFQPALVTGWQFVRRDRSGPQGTARAVSHRRAVGRSGANRPEWQQRPGQRIPMGPTKDHLLLMRRTEDTATPVEVSYRLVDLDLASG